MKDKPGMFRSVAECVWVIVWTAIFYATLTLIGWCLANRLPWNVTSWGW